MNETTIREILNRTVPTIDWSMVATADSLEEAGLDSLDKASVFLEIETTAGAQIPDEDYGDIDSIEGIIAHLEKNS